MALRSTDATTVDLERSEAALIVGEEDGSMSVRVVAGADVPEGGGDLPAAPEIVLALAMRLLHAYFAHGRNISKTDVVAEVTGGDRETVSAALNDEQLKNDLRRRTDEAAARGIFGSPFFIVDGEAFWGNDRIDDVIRWANGAW